MKSLLLMFVLLPTLFPFPRQTSSDPAHRPAQVNQKTTGKQNVATPLPIKNPSAPEESQNEGKNPASKREPRHIIIDNPPLKDLWDKVYICLTGALVVIAAFSLRAIWIQAVQTKTAAEAALLNAKALINIERAWMGIYIQLAPRLSIAEHSASTTVTLEFTCTNHGKTPAWINLAEIGVIILSERIAVPNSMPETKSFPVIGPELVPAGKDMAREGQVVCEGKITRDHPALVYGKVTYFDILHEPRLTTFGFWINEDRTVDRLPFVYPAYNEYT